MLTVSKGRLLTMGGVLGALVGGVVAGATLFGQTAAPRPIVSPTPTPQSSPAAPTTTGVSENEESAGTALATIQGKRIFPAEGIPSDFRVCALNLSNQKQRCVTGNDPTYQLPVPDGQYQLFAIVPSFDPNYRAYYSRFVTCGLRTECSDHTPITVTVTDGQTIDEIDVGDFYR